jgi:antitoxin ParD1/3/4
MNVHLTPELKELVEARVASGRYSSASEVIRAGLRLLEEDERWRDDVRRRISEGLAAAKLGKFVDGEEFFRELRESLMHADTNKQT